MRTTTRSISVAALLLSLAPAPDVRAQDGGLRGPPPPAEASARKPGPKPASPSEAERCAGERSHARAVEARLKLVEARTHLDRFNETRFGKHADSEATIDGFRRSIGESRVLAAEVSDPAERQKVHEEANLLVLRGLFARQNWPKSFLTG